MKAQKLLFRIGIYLLLLTLFSCGEDSSAPASTRLALTQVFTFTDTDYHFHLTGRVKNFSPFNAEEVVVTARLFSDPDRRIPISVIQQPLNPVPAAEGARIFDLSSSPLRVLPGANGLPGIFYQVAVSGREGDTRPIPAPELVLVEDRLLTDIFGRYHVRGKITNRSRIPAEMVYFTVSFFRNPDQTDLITRLRRGFGRFLGTPELEEETSDSEASPSSYPSYLVDIWHPEITSERYPSIFYSAEVSE